MSGTEERDLTALREQQRYAVLVVLPVEIPGEEELLRHIFAGEEPPP